MQTDIQRDHARMMRKNLTRAEVILWSRLRRRALNGFRFNRQVEIGPYIVDFTCREQKLVIEVDGTLHTDTVSYDNRRTRFLENKGYRVLRILNEDIYADIDAVLRKITSALLPHA